MHFKSLRHVRDHVKVRGRAYDLLLDIALHVNYHTGEAFELTVERLAHRHAITPEWTRRLLHAVIATGELFVERSRGRHPNRYRFPLERCHACQDSNLDVASGGDDVNPEVGSGDEINPELHPSQPPTAPASTLNCTRPNPELRVAAGPHLARLEPLKEVKEVKDIKERSTPNKNDSLPHKPEMRNPFWCDAHGFAHGERLDDHRPDCARERDVRRTPTPMAPLSCVGKPGKGQTERQCAFHGLTHYPRE